jgi:hypothetical protein
MRRRRAPTVASAVDPVFIARQGEGTRSKNALSANEMKRA